MTRWALVLVVVLWALPASAQRVFTRTLHVEDLAIDGNTLWVATQGGVEEYDIPTRTRRRVYTTEDGLLEHAVRRVTTEGGTVRVVGDASECTLVDRAFVCRAAAPLPAVEPAVAPMFRGLRVTRRVGNWVGTAGGGLWIDEATPSRITPSGQVCSNHITSMAEYRGRLWLASFDQGLCSHDAAGFHEHRAPFRMVNDLAATPKGLYVAASEGLFRTTDGTHFERVAFVDSRGVNDLDFDGHTLYATTPSALYRIRIQGGRPSRAIWMPGGSHAIQAVATLRETVWLATEDRGVVRLRSGTRKVQVFDRAAGLPTSWAVDVAVTADGTPVVATLRHGLLRLSPEGVATSIAGVPDSWLLHVSVDPRGGLLVGTQEGAAEIDRSEQVRAVPHLPHPSVHALYRQGPILWVATEGGLLAQDSRARENSLARR
jgi:ligand-binding sensor domain-containing protein